jgi:hypothetical protein
VKKSGHITSVLVIAHNRFTAGVSLSCFTHFLCKLETQCDSYACLQSVAFNVASSEITCWRLQMVTGGIWFGDIPSYKHSILKNNSPPPPKRSVPYMPQFVLSDKNKAVFKFEVLAFLWSLCEFVMYTKFKIITLVYFNTNLQWDQLIFFKLPATVPN